MAWSSEWKNDNPDWIKEGAKKLIDLVPDSYNTSKQLTVRNGQKDYTFSAEIVGDLALDFDDDGWNIYYVPTLSLFSSAVPINHAEDCISHTPADISKCTSNCNYQYDKQPLLNWMKKVQENYPTSWTMLRYLTPDDYQNKCQSAKDIIKKWCLSVKVEE